MGRLLLAVIVLAGCWSAWNSWRLRPLQQPPGVLVTQEPAQLAPDPPVRFSQGSYQIEALARYRIRGRLLHRERYRMDPMADFAPLDFGLGWGPMSDTAVLEKIRFTQAARFLNWHWDSPAPPIPFEVLNSHASNNHLIPADGAVFSALNRMRVGQVVELNGYLVKVRGGNGEATSSLTRNDMGANACEIMYVQDAQIIQ